MASPDVLGQVLADFSTKGKFPEEEATSALHISASALPGALAVLHSAKADLQTEIRGISRKSAPSVDEWIKHAKSIQDDIEKSRKLANSIVRQAEADEHRLEILQEKNTYVDFMTKEVSFNGQLLVALKSLQQANALAHTAETLASQKKILPAVDALANAWKALQDSPLEKGSRARRLLDTKCLNLRKVIEEQFFTVWDTLIQVDRKKHSITILQQDQIDGSNLDDAVVVLKSYHRLDEAVRNLWEKIDQVILQPRTSITAASLPAIGVKGSVLSLMTDSTDRTIKSLFQDLSATIDYLANNLPEEIVGLLSQKMMPELSRRVLESWLDTAIPSSLDDMLDYQKALALVVEFTSKLENMKWPGVGGLEDWVTSAPKLWLNKRRETALDWTRNQMAMGLGTPQAAERIETRMIARDEGHHIASTGSTNVTQDWDDAWDGSGEDDTPEAEKISDLPKSPLRNRRSIEETRRAGQVVTPVAVEDDEVDGDAWGWGDEEETETGNASQQSSLEPGSPLEEAHRRSVAPDTREMTLSEKYYTSSIPKTILATISTLYNDGAVLLQPGSKSNPVSAAGPGLFGLPALILAMFRAIAPCYYPNAYGGNMYLYNDSMWLSENLRELANVWKKRPDIPERARTMIKLDPETTVLESFGKRAYTNELNAQRTVINDLLGGSQNFFQQEGSLKGELEENIRTVIHHVRGQASLWEGILTYSAWASAVGSLVNTIASKLISDVFDLSDIGVDEAERTARILSTVESLDDLFLRKQANSSEKEKIPLTSQFADKWMKMKFLGEVLQSNLVDVKFLWFDSDLSLYFDVDEVVELIGLSFEQNAGVRQAIRELRETPHPRN